MYVTDWRPFPVEDKPLLYVSTASITLNHESLFLCVFSFDCLAATLHLHFCLRFREVVVCVYISRLNSMFFFECIYKGCPHQQSDKSDAHA